MTKCAPPAVSTGVTVARLAQQADQLGGLEGGNAATDDEKDAAHALGCAHAAAGAHKLGDGARNEDQPDQRQGATSSAQ